MITFIFVLACLYFMLPAYIANMTPVFMRGYKFLDKPIDGNRKINGKEILGKNKTWRGLIFAVLAAGFVGLFQFYLYPIMPSFGLIDYGNAKIVFLAALLLGFGAILGDLVESFFKRRIGIPSGKPWILFDQMDFVIGALLLVLIVFIPSLEAAIVIIIISPILHVLANLVGYYLKIRSSKF